MRAQERILPHDGWAHSLGDVPYDWDGGEARLIFSIVAGGDPVSYLLPEYERGEGGRCTWRFDPPVFLAAGTRFTVDYVDLRDRGDMGCVYAAPAFPTAIAGDTGR